LIQSYNVAYVTKAEKHHEYIEYKQRQP